MSSDYKISNVRVKINHFYVNFYTKLHILFAKNHTKLHESTFFSSTDTYSGSVIRTFHLSESPFYLSQLPFAALPHSIHKKKPAASELIHFKYTSPIHILFPEAAVPNSNQLPAHSSSYLIISYFNYFLINYPLFLIQEIIL